VRPAKEKDLKKLPSIGKDFHEDLSPWVVECRPKLSDDVYYDPDDDDDEDLKGSAKKPLKFLAVVNEEDLFKRRKDAYAYAGR
jgi:hypothetical protein